MRYIKPVFYDEFKTGRAFDEDNPENRFQSRYMDMPNRPLYPFGYGLSYTTFEYSDLTITPTEQNPEGKVTVTCRVTNTGSRAGDEVVQLYINDCVSSVTTYTKVLRGFERIALQPGETKSVSFTLGPQELGLWDKDMKFTVEPGKFEIMIGASSKDIRLTGNLEIK